MRVGLESHPHIHVHEGVCGILCAWIVGGDDRFWMPQHVLKPIAEEVVHRSHVARMLMRRPLPRSGSAFQDHGWDFPHRWDHHAGCPRKRIKKIGNRIHWLPYIYERLALSAKRGA
jgi:hypothetical protein